MLFRRCWWRKKHFGSWLSYSSTLNFADELAPPEYPADVLLSGHVHLGRNPFNEVPGWHGTSGFFAFRSVQLVKNCGEKDNLSTN